MNQNKWLESSCVSGDPFGYNPLSGCRYSISETTNTVGASRSNPDVAFLSSDPELGSKLVDIENELHQSPESKPIQIIGLMLNDQLFGVEIESVMEIVVPAAITRVPHAPDYVSGVMNLRGTITPVINLHRRFEIEPSSRNSNTRIIILTVNEQPLGFLVDAVTEIYSVWPTDIEAGSGFSMSLAAPFLKGIVKLDENSALETDDLIILLNLNAIAQGISHVPA